MVSTLRERYEDKQVQHLRKRAARVDQVLLAEERTSRLLVEAMNEEDLKKVAAIIQKLGTIKVPELPKLKAAIEQAEAEINRYTAGGPLTAAWTKMKDLVGIDNPIVKVTVFADALEKGFSQIPQILRNNGIDLKDVDLNKSLAQQLRGFPTVEPQKPKDTKDKPGYKSDNQLGNTTFSGTQTEANDVKYGSKDIDAKLKSIASQLQKALSPGGLFGAFKKVPYIDSSALAMELIQAPLRVFSAVAKRINSGAKAAEVAPDLKGQIAGAGAAETKGTEQGEPTQKTSQTDPTTPAKPTTGAAPSVAAGEKPAKPQGGGKLPPNYAMAHQKVSALMKSLKGKKDPWGELARKLVDAGLDPDKL